MTPSLILINPWIYDFAAYDLWSKPLGLLYIAGFLRQCGFRIHLIDCLDVNDPSMKGNPGLKPPLRRKYGTGKYWRQEVPRPAPLKDVARSYSRYGQSLSAFEDELKKVGNPAAILVTSLMTYWYPGVREAIRISRRVHPEVPVILGGIYARLCLKHATEDSRPDRILTDGGSSVLIKALEEFGIAVPIPSPRLIAHTRPAFDLLTRIEYICLMTSTGCPYRCQYCASHFLNPRFTRRNPEEVLEEILYWHREHSVRDFAFYDDALLCDSEEHLGKLLEDICRYNLPLRFHTPNALHVKGITGDMARLMRRSGFRTIRLGLETSDISLHRSLDNKVGEGDFDMALHNLHEAGFRDQDIGAYILIGLPGQSVDSVFQTIEDVGGSGAIPFLSEYSPIPHTALWEQAVSHSKYDLASEPLFHNNTLLPCWDEDSKRDVPLLKKKVLEIRNRYR
jgi:radical SAM superfamily enzyme YgiQ (UPF0313 family)